MTSPAAKAGTIALGGELTVNRLGFGAMRLTGPGIIGPHENPAECRRVLRRAVELGINFIDTADSYGPHVCEELIAEALHPYPSDLVIATKGGYERPGPNQWKPNGRPEHLRAACESSLKRLRLERIDLYQLHRIDPDVPEEEQLGALEDLRREGKIRFIGLCEVGVAAIDRARRKLSIVSVQNRYNVADRAWDDVVDYCEREGLAFIPWYPLGAGSVGALPQVEAIAKKSGVSPWNVALAWLLSRSKTMLPIPGTSQIAHLEDNVSAARMKRKESGKAMSRAALLVFTSCAAEQEDAFNRWYDEVHVPDVLQVEGFTAARRYRLTGPGTQMITPEGSPATPRYLVLYELETDDTTAAMKRLNDAVQDLRRRGRMFEGMQFVAASTYAELGDRGTA